MVPYWFPLKETSLAIQKAEETKAPRVGISFAN
jgi:hypothetical protein